MRRIRITSGEVIFRYDMKGMVIDVPEDTQHVEEYLTDEYPELVWYSIAEEIDMGVEDGRFSWDHTNNLTYEVEDDDAYVE